MKTTTLYCRDLNQNVLIWRISKVNSIVYVEYGRLKGKLAKVNLGELSPHQIGKRILDKLADGYIDLKSKVINNLTEAEVAAMLPIGDYTSTMLKRMKAQVYVEYKLQPDSIIQPKLNGYRALLQWEDKHGDLFNSGRAVLRSMEGYEYYLPDITQDLRKEDFLYKDIVIQYDGELYEHGTRSTKLKSKIPMVKDGTTSKASLPFNGCFCVFDLSIPDKLQHQRLNIMKYKLRQSASDIVMYHEHGSDYSTFGDGKGEDNYEHYLLPTRYSGIKMLRSFIVLGINDAFVKKACSVFITAGFEGVIIRCPYAEYRFGLRPRTMLKLKNVYTTMAKLISIIENRETSLKKSISCMMQLLDNPDVTFKSTPIANNELINKILANVDNYLGKTFKVLHREVTDMSKPFHSNVIIPDEDEE